MRPRFASSRAGGVVTHGAGRAGRIPWPLVLWPVVLWSVVLAGCGSSNEAVEVTAPSPTGVVASQCRHLVDVLPDTVADDEQARDVTPSDAPAAAWGDPPVVLRCGVPKPSALVPTSACFEVDGVGWLATQDGEEVSGDEPVSGTLTWTTIGRSAYVEVSVPEADGRQPSDPLPALAPAIKQTIPLVHPCQ